MKPQAHNPFVELLGFDPPSFEGGEATIVFRPKPEHENSFKVMHGGVIMSLLDVAMAHAARSLEPAMGCVTIEMKTSFMRAAQGPMQAKGKLLYRSTTMVFTEGRVFNAEGQLCAHATGTFKLVPRLPVGKSTHAVNAPNAKPPSATSN